MEDGILYATEPLERAVFLERPNRFIVRVQRRPRPPRAPALSSRRASQQTTLAHIGNPGRMGEILLPRTEVLLASRPHTASGWEAVGAVWAARWPGDRPRAVCLETGRINHLARALIEKGCIPELADHRIVQSEFVHGRSRFDFLLQGPAGPYLLEVKSVTLTEHGLALFPDAQSARARRHLQELSRCTRRDGWHAGVLFLVQGEATRFLPDFHNDLLFSRAFRRARAALEFLPYALEPRLHPDGRLVFDSPPRRLDIPWNILATGTRDHGLYLLVLHLPRTRRLALGKLGSQRFDPGWYVYAGAARRGLARRLGGHLRRRQRPIQSIDVFRAACDRAEAFPIRTATEACALAEMVARLGTLPLRGFGSPDCTCAGHLIRVLRAPTRTAPFQELLTAMRHRL